RWHSRAARRRRSGCRSSGSRRSSSGAASRTLRTSRPAPDWRCLPGVILRPKVRVQGRSRRGSTGPDVSFLRATIPALLAVLLAATLSGAGAAAPAAVAEGSCPPPGATAAYAHKVRAALYARHDVLGRRLLAKPGGPSYDRVRDVLAPLFYAAGGGGRKLTESGAYYLPFAYPFNVNGARLFALHVADGSEIVARRGGGPSVTVYVGPNGKERYGSCLRRLDTATLANGYLPILDTSYTDVTGVKYQQESFVGRAFGTISLSYVHIHVDATSATRDTQVRLVPTPGTLAHQGNQLLSHGSTRLVWSGDAEVDHSAVTFDIPAG